MGIMIFQCQEKQNTFKMNRRFFSKTITAAGIGATATGQLWAASSIATSAHKYNLHYAPHLGMFRHHAGNDPIDQLNFIADQGFTAFEDNDMRKRPIAMQKKMADIMTKRELKMGVFVAHEIYWRKPNLASGDPEMRAEFLSYIRAALDVAKRVNAKWMTVVPGFVDLRQNMAFQTAHVVESLKQASAILEPHDLVMVLEPLNFRDHPGLFLSQSPQAYEICRSVDSPSCKILFDIYHLLIYSQQGLLLPNAMALGGRDLLIGPNRDYKSHIFPRCLQTIYIFSKEHHQIQKH